MENLEALQSALPNIIDGTLITVWLTLGGAVLAFVVAVTLGLAARHDLMVVRGPARVVIEFFRGTSLLIQLFWLFYVLPLFGFSLGSLVTGILALGLNYGAYAAEVVRGSINAVPKGQWETTTALSMGRVHRMRRIIWPQAWAIMIPSLANLLVMLLKGTAVASVILLQDLTFRTGQLRQSTGDTFFSYGVGMLIYFAIAYLLLGVCNGAENRAKHRLGTREKKPFFSTTSGAPGNAPSGVG